MKRADRVDCILLVVFLIAAAVRLIGLRYGLPDLLYYDEYFLVNKAIGFGRGDFNPHFFNYPALQMYLLFVVVALVYVYGALTGRWHGPWEFAVSYFRNPEPLQMPGRLLTVLFALGTVWVVYKLAGKIYDRRAAVAAALVLAVSPLHAEHSRYIITDIPLTFWILLSLWFSASYCDSGKLGHLVLSAFAVGLATATKYPGFVALTVPIAAVLFCRKLRPATSLIQCSAVAAVFIAGFAVGAPYSFLSFREFVQGVSFEIWHVSVAGHVMPAGSENGWLVHLTHSLPEIAAWPVLAVAAFGALAFVLMDFRRGLLLLVFPVVFFLLIGAQKVLFARYALPLAPFIAVFAGVAFARLMEAARRPFLQAAAAATGLFLLLPMVDRSLLNALSRIGPDTRTQARRWFEANIPPDSGVMVTVYAAPLKPSKRSLMRDQERVRRKLGEMMANDESFEKSSAKFKILDAAYSESARYDVYRFDRLTGDDLFDALVAEGVRYAALDSQTTDVFRAAKAVYPSQYNLLAEIESRGRIVKTFQPVPVRLEGVLRLFSFMKPLSTGPVISIYSLSDVNSLQNQRRYSKDSKRNPLHR